MTRDLGARILLLVAITLLFTTLQAKVVVTTLPDLHRYSLRRSSYPVHYLYVFLAINSTHMVYRESAFDSFIFNVGRSGEAGAQAILSTLENTTVRQADGREPSILAAG